MDSTKKRISYSPIGKERTKPDTDATIINNNIIDENVYMDLTAVAPSPSRDYYRLRVDKEKVCFVRWQITHKAKMLPNESVVALAKFHEEHRLVGEITGIFGENIAKYVIGLGEGKLDWIIRLDTKILTKILGYVGIKNLSSFAPVCKRFHEISNSNALWKIFYKEFYRGKIPDEICLHANYLGWKTTFFINRLQFNVFPGKKMRLGLEDASHYGLTSVAPGNRRRGKPGSKKLGSMSELELSTGKLGLGGGDTSLKSKILEYQRKVSGNRGGVDSSSSTPNIGISSIATKGPAAVLYAKYETIRQNLGLEPKPLPPITDRSLTITGRFPPLLRLPPISGRFPPATAGGQLGRKK